MRDSRTVINEALLSEKGAHLRETANQYIFDVAVDANKIEIKRAVEEIFGVEVEKVTTAIRRGKHKRMGRFAGMRRNWKRAVVTLKKGDTIDLFDQV